MLVLPVLVIALRLFGGPQHVTRRPTAINFWALDLSGGAGGISSPQLLEHPKNVSECAMFSERVFRALAGDAPAWLLYSGIGIATRELASRQVQEQLVSALGETGGSREKALTLSLKLRENFDNRVQRVLQPAGYGNAERLINRWVDDEINDLGKQISSPYDVLDHEITRAVLDVAEAEVVGRVQDALVTVSGLNQTAAERDLAEIFRKADADGNDVITFDELYELMLGQPIYPLARPYAREWAVLKSPESADSPWEASASLLIAPQLKRLSQVLSISRRMWDRAPKELEKATDTITRDVTERFWELDKSLGLGLQDSGMDLERKARLDEMARILEVARQEEQERARLAKRSRWRKPWTWRRRDVQLDDRADVQPYDEDERADAGS